MCRNTRSSTRPIRLTRTDVKNLLMGRIADAVHLTISRPIANIPFKQIDDVHCEFIASKIISYLNFRIFGPEKEHASNRFLIGIVVQERCNESIYPHFHIQFICPDGMSMETFRRRLEKAADCLCEPTC